MDNLKRVTIMLPEDVYEEFKEAAERSYSTMSHIGRQLVIEYLQQQRRDQKPAGKD